MWLAKLRQGVLRIATPVGPRYLRPSLAQRAYLLWMFRNFHVLPVQVLTPKQQELVAQLSGNDQCRVTIDERVEDVFVIGTVERLSPMAAPGSRTNSGVTLPAGAHAAGSKR